MTTKMERTLISLPKSDMRWLKNAGKNQGASTASLVREAVKQYRATLEKDTGWKDRLQATAGLWKERGIDALKYVEDLRSEWDK